MDFILCRIFCKSAIQIKFDDIIMCRLDRLPFYKCQHPGLHVFSVCLSLVTVDSCLRVF